MRNVIFASMLLLFVAQGSINAQTPTVELVSMIPPQDMEARQLQWKYTFKFSGVRGANSLSITMRLPDAAVSEPAQVEGKWTFTHDTAEPEEEVDITLTGPRSKLRSDSITWSADIDQTRLRGGAVTVRVFSLPLNTGVPQELTGAPRNLGALAAKSALNIKLAEDILTPLGITLPYTSDGGNLTLEFTIQAADVRGVAQVFSSSFAFGTYPLAIIQ